MNVDILTDLNITEFINFHKEHDDFVTLAVSDRESSRKLLFDDSMILKGWMNTNTGEQKLAEFNKGFRPLAFSGIHCINSQIFDMIKRTGKFSIMEEYLDFMMTERINGYLHDAYLVDVGKPESILLAEEYFK